MLKNKFYKNFFQSLSCFITVIFSELEKINPDDLTAREALQKLYELQDLLKKEA